VNSNTHAGRLEAAAAVSPDGAEFTSIVPRLMFRGSVKMKHTWVRHSSALPERSPSSTARREPA
jgi:hypothetical protein